VNERHVTLIADLVSHEDTEMCVCGPDVRFVAGGKLVIHHSLDGREKRESDEA